MRRLTCKRQVTNQWNAGNGVQVCGRPTVAVVVLDGEDHAVCGIHKRQLVTTYGAVVKPAEDKPHA